MKEYVANKVKVSLTLLISMCNVLNVNVDFILQNEYHIPTFVIEKISKDCIRFGSI